jgi:hypothetical protein
MRYSTLTSYLAKVLAFAASALLRILGVPAYHEACARPHIGWTAGSFLVAALVLAPQTSKADEGGVSFWVPGFFGSLAAAPQVPGFALANIYYHSSVTGGADVAFARQVHRGNIGANFTGNLNISLAGRADLYMAIPSYTFAQPFLGGQAQVVMAVPYGRGKASVDGTLSGNFGLGGPGFIIGGSSSDSVTGFGDLVPQFNVRWNNGVHNYMTYLTGNLTVGNYDASRLVNLGIGHNAIDAGGGYTYFNPQTGNEFSATLGFTYNFENTHTQYQNGVDMHLDLGASRFITKEFQLGLVGYFYQQLSCDSGVGNRVGCFESRVAGVGPQVGYVIPINEHYQGYFNLKGYKEFAADHRADGWNVWLTFAISPAAPHQAPPTRSGLITK